MRPVTLLGLQVGKVAFVAVWASCAAALGACVTDRSRPPPGIDGAAPSAAAPSASDRSDPGRGPSVRVSQLLELENRRSTQGITDDDVGHHHPEVRRQVAQTLARSGALGAVPQLLRLLPDEDAEVVAWSAYGLGYLCRADDATAPTIDTIVRALTSRGATDLPPARDAGNSARVVAGALSPAFAISRALGHCATSDAENTLANWLTRPPFAAFAALALGDVASRKKALDDTTQAALLGVASASPPLGEALYPFGRFERPSASLAARLATVAEARLVGTPSPTRIFAVRALARTGRSAAAVLRRTLTSAADFTGPERVEAARGLGKLGAAGRDALASALSSLMPARADDLATASFGPLLVTLESLVSAPEESHKALFELAHLTPARDASPAMVRRAATLRCRAAVLLVNGRTEDPLLAGCDGGQIGARARLEVVGKRPLEGARLAAFERLLASPYVKVRELSVELLAAHPEVRETSRWVADLLVAPEPGVVATAAEFVAAHPDRVLSDGATNHQLAANLETALARAWPPDSTETMWALLEAAGAARVMSTDAIVDSYCRHENPTLRVHAARALSLLRGTQIHCAEGTSTTRADELDHLVSTALTLELTTDVGALKITLDPSRAPVAVTRFVDLARAGFYDGIKVHRVVPGFVVQFGDPTGDGFGGAGKLPLRCETTPTPFDALDVGVALAGRDTGGSQMFVTLARSPHLDEEYARIGSAIGDFAALAEGDEIRAVKVLP